LTGNAKTSQNIAFKVVDEEVNAPFTEELFKYASANNHPVEMGFYHGNPKLLLDFQAIYKIQRPTLHTNHYKFDLGTLLEKPSQKHKLIEALSVDLELATKIDAKRVVIHPYKYPFPRKKIAQKKTIEALLPELEGVANLLEAGGITAHIENTFDEANFYLALFEAIRSKGVSNLGFCFDMGHAKVWSALSFDEWFKHLEEIDKLGFDMHFHIHANDGIFDDHLPFLPTILNDLDKNDEFTNGYPKALKRLFDRFGNSTYTAEVRPEFAIENMKILSALADD
jgi:Xylose isomerase-like TIM barrel